MIYDKNTVAFTDKNVVSYAPLGQGFRIKLKSLIFF